MPLQPLRTVDRVLFVLGKVLHYTYILLLPIYVLGVAAIWRVVLPLELVGGWFLASVFAVSHNAEDATYNAEPDMDWAEMQVLPGVRSVRVRLCLSFVVCC